MSYPPDPPANLESVNLKQLKKKKRVVKKEKKFKEKEKSAC